MCGLNLSGVAPVDGAGDRIASFSFSMGCTAPHVIFHHRELREQTMRFLAPLEESSFIFFIVSISLITLDISKLSMESGDRLAKSSATNSRSCSKVSTRSTFNMSITEFSSLLRPFLLLLASSSEHQE